MDPQIESWVLMNTKIVKNIDLNDLQGKERRNGHVSFMNALLRGEKNFLRAIHSLKA